MLLSKEVISKNMLGYGLMSRDKLSNHSIFGPSYGTGGIDEYTKLMLHMNGANGSTTFTDSSLSPKTVTRAGNAQISTAQYKFGGASGLFDGNGDYISIPHHTDFDFGSGDFTIDFRVYITKTGAQRIIQKDYTSDFCPWRIGILEDGRIFFDISLNGSSWGISGNTGVAVSQNAWRHVALIRNGSNINLCIDGTSLSSKSITGSIFANSKQITIGEQGNGFYGYGGYIDELRLS